MSARCQAAAQTFFARTPLRRTGAQLCLFLAKSHGDGGAFQLPLTDLVAVLFAGEAVAVTFTTPVSEGPAFL